MSNSNSELITPTESLRRLKAARTTADRKECDNLVLSRETAEGLIAAIESAQSEIKELQADKIFLNSDVKFAQARVEELEKAVKVLRDALLLIDPDGEFKDWETVAGEPIEIPLVTALRTAEALLPDSEQEKQDG